MGFTSAPRQPRRSLFWLRQVRAAAPRVTLAPKVFAARPEKLQSIELNVSVPIGVCGSRRQEREAGMFAPLGEHFRADTIRVVLTSVRAIRSGNTAIRWRRFSRYGRAWECVVARLP
jgi:hypothetical protein